MLDKYTAAYKAGYLPSNVLDNSYEGNSTLFSKQQVAWTTGGGNLITSLQQDNPTLAPNVVPSPALDTAPLYVQGLSVASKSKNLPLALAFAEYVTDDENQAGVPQAGTGLPAGLRGLGQRPACTARATARRRATPR